MRSRSRNICICAAFSAIGILVAYLESFIVLPVRIPGIRIGIANIVTLIALYLMGPVYAAVILIVRVALSALLFGSLTSFVYSISGAFLAFLSMIVVKRSGFSICCVSVTGAVFHNTGQILAASVIVSNRYVFMYLPVLVLTAVIFGMLTGVLGRIMIDRLGSVVYLGEREGIK